MYLGISPVDRSNLPWLASRCSLTTHKVPRLEARITRSSPWARIKSVLLGSLWLSLAACDRPALITDVDTVTAMRLQQRLEIAGIAADIQAQDNRGLALRVAATDVARAVSALDCRVRVHARDPCAPTPAPLFPTPRHEADRLRRETACTLAYHAELLPGVVEARVQLSTPAPRSLDEPPPRTRATVVARVGEGFDPESIRRLLRTAIPDLGPADIQITATHVPTSVQSPCSPWAQLGPIRLDASSLPLAKGMLAFLASLNGLSAVLLLLVWHRARRR